jgi:hypothetical protein
VKTFQVLFTDDEPSAVSERLRPRPEDTVLNEPVEPSNEF